MKNKYTTFLIISLLSNLVSAETLTIARVADIPDQQLGAAILQSAYEKLNIKLEFIDFPGSRGLIESSSGRVDGEMQRVYEAGEIYPSLIRVPTPYTYMDAILFSNKKLPPITGWSSLKDLKIGMIRGNIFAEKGLEGNENTVKVSGTTSQLKIMESQRVDAILITMFGGLHSVKKNKLESIKPVLPILERIPLYFYLHEKNKHRVSEIDAVFKAMRDSGELEELRSKHIIRLLDQLEKE